MTTKPFDCVETVEAAQVEIQETLEALSREEQLAHWQTQTEKLRGRQRQNNRFSREDRVILSDKNDANEIADEVCC